MNNKIKIGEKVLLYGFHDGFSYETDGTINYVIQLETGKKVEIPVGGVMKENRIITRRDVISRMKQLFPLSRSEWIDEILKEFGEEFGSIKYLSGYEQGKLEGAWVGNQLKDADKIRQELNKVLLPSFIEDWIFKCQLLNDFSLRGALDSNTIHLYAKNSKVVEKWLHDKKNQELFAKAWVTDYEAEKEPKYKVKVKNTDDYLNETEIGFHFFNNRKDNKTFTRKELEYSDFSWVLDCPGIELEEVKK